MLVSSQRFLQREGVYQMSLDQLIHFKDKIYNTIKHYEDTKYTIAVLENELYMNPAPSVYYWWHCDCFKKVCGIILAHEDCDEKLKEKCTQDIKEAHEKIKKGLYHNSAEVCKIYEELRGN